VHWYARTKKWQAKIKVDGVVHHLGYFQDEMEAARAYDRAAYAASLTARGNFPISDYPDFKAAFDEAKEAWRAKVARSSIPPEFATIREENVAVLMRRDQNR
jgi:hypothetical protein